MRRPLLVFAATGLSVLASGLVVVPRAGAQTSLDCPKADGLPSLGAIYDYPGVNVYSFGWKCELQEGYSNPRVLTVKTRARYYEDTKRGVESVTVDWKGQPTPLHLEWTELFDCNIDPWDAPDKSKVDCSGFFVDPMPTTVLLPWATSINGPATAIGGPKGALKFSKQPAAQRGIFPAPILKVAPGSGGKGAVFTVTAPPPGLDVVPEPVTIAVQRWDGQAWVNANVKGKALGEVPLHADGSAALALDSWDLAGNGGTYRFRGWYGGSQFLKNTKTNWTSFKVVPGFPQASPTSPTTPATTATVPTSAAPASTPTTTPPTTAPVTITSAPTTVTTAPPIKLAVTTTIAPAKTFSILTPVAGINYKGTVPVLIKGGSGSYVYEFQRANGQPIPNGTYSYTEANFPSGMKIGVEKFPGAGSYRIRAREASSEAWSGFVVFNIVV